MPLASFVIGGERRSGTTALALWMSNHPDIYLLDRDPSFFSDDLLVGRREWLDGPVDYATWDETPSLQKCEAIFAEANGEQFLGEKTAAYLFWEPTHPRLVRMLPNAKFLFILRNPINRAWSHYWNEVGKGRETLGFKEALAAEPERSAQSDYARYHLSYGQPGQYAESLQRFFEHIPPERVKVVTLEGFLQDPRSMLQEVYRFLGADPTKGLAEAGTQYNKNWATVTRPWVEKAGLEPVARRWERLTGYVVRPLVRSDRFLRREWHKRLTAPFMQPARRQEMPGATRARLRERYRPHVRNLEALLGRKLTEWPEFRDAS